MKKYLMIGFVAAVAFTSCSKHDFTTMSEEQIKEAEYANNFVKRYGEPAKGHSWGFGSSSVSAPAFTRTNSANNNEWGWTVEVPYALTEAQINKVTDWFTRTKNPQGIAVNWSDFFVQAVSSTFRGVNMNYLTCGAEDEHIANFNKGDGSPKDPVNYGVLPGNDKNNYIGKNAEAEGIAPNKINYMVNSSTSRFGYHNSYDSQMYYDYVIIPGEVIDPANETGIHGMYFVGFDYQHNKADDNDYVALDGYFNDWIVKITPGLPKSYDFNQVKRVICEDLGNTDDFDFNDVVFDAYFDNGQTVICVRAAGGTLPLKVAGVEVHEALLVGPKEMVNTGLKSVPVAIYRVNDTYGYNIKNIPIVVTQNAVQYTIKADAGEAPQKLAVTTDYVWCSERQNIEEKYPAFKNYVASEDVSWY